MADLSAREEYTICFSPKNSAIYFKDYLISFARQEGMEVFDRSREAEGELRSLDHGNIVLDNTVGSLILVTIERKDMVRISITNAGLGNDLNLTFRYSPGARPSEASRVLRVAAREFRVIPIESNGAAALSCDTS